MDQCAIIVFCEVAVLSIVDFCLKVPSIKLLLKNPSFHKRITSDIPGNPHAFDNEIISLFNTLPEPSNFNMVWTNVNYGEAMLIRGRLPPSRINSLSLYTRQGNSQGPISVDLETIMDKNRHFELIVANETNRKKLENSSIFVLFSSNWQRGFVSLRNYLVPDGSLVHTPEIVRLSDNNIIRKSDYLVSGPAILEDIFQKKNKRLQFSRSVLFLILFSLNAFLVRHGDLDINEFEFSLAVGLLVLITSSSYSKLLFLLGKRRLRSSTQFCEKVNQFYLSSDDQAAESSQPCSLHKYWVMKFDIPVGDTLSITGIINPSDQKYWSLVIYDEFGLPLPQYIFDKSVHKIDLSMMNIKADGLPNDSDAYGFDIRLRNCCCQGPFREIDAANEVDVSQCSKGYILFRRVHSGSKEKRVLRCPESRVVSIDDTKNE